MTRYTRSERAALTLKCANPSCGRSFKPNGQHKHATRHYCSTRCRLACQRVSGFRVIEFDSKRRSAS